MNISKYKMTLSLFLKNRSLMLATFIFQFSFVLYILAIAYIVFVTNEAYLNSASNIIESVILLAIVTVVTIFINFFYLVFSFTRIRTLTLAIPVGILTIVFVYFGAFTGMFEFFALLGVYAFGVIMGIFFSSFFYGPAIWFYFRFRMPYASVGWISTLYFSTLMVVNAYKIDSDIYTQATSLIRPDYMAITAAFFFVTLLLLLLDNNQALARWRRLPHINLKMPYRTIVPIIAVLMVTTVCTSITSPILWKVFWEYAESEKNGSKLQEDDLPKDADDGRSGNMKNDDGKVTMNPDQGLKDELNQSPNGEPAILFTVQPTEYSYSELYDESETITDKQYYWKMENLDSYTPRRGFFNDFEYNTEWIGSGKIGYYKYYKTLGGSDYITDTTKVSQKVVFYNLETNWIIGSNSQYEIRMLLGNEREYFQFTNESFITEKNKPFYKGDSYEIVSRVSNLDTDKEIKRLNDIKISKANNEKLDKYKGFDDQEVSKLAQNITKDKITQVDKTLAIRDYLLTNYSYSLKPGAPVSMTPNTEGIDRIKYFLFENKKGYCAYFASAMTALLRSQDIPARMVGGFSQGKYSEELDTFIVTDSEAHAWVEVYFDEYGWITFDPTPPSDEEQKQSEKNLEEQLTKQVKNQMNDYNEKIQKQIDSYNKYESKQINKEVQQSNFNPTVPAWVPELFMLMAEIGKILLPLLCVGTILLIVITPPLINVYIDMSLLGKFSARGDREHILSLFKLIERHLRKLDSNYTRLPHETAIEYYQRLVAQKFVNDEITDDLNIACEIYNRAAFRHKIEDLDRANMERAISNIEKYISSRTPYTTLVVNIWRL